MYRIDWDYPQTWPYAEKMRRTPLLGHFLFWLIQSFCGFVTGHEISKTEWGYGGGNYCDRYCRWCDKIIKVPKTAVQFEFKDSSSLMKMVGRNNGHG